MNASCVIMSDIAHLNSCLSLSPAPCCSSPTTRDQARENQMKQELFICWMSFKLRWLIKLWFLWHSCQTRLTGICDSGHSLQCVGPSGVLVPGHGDHDAMLCAADGRRPVELRPCSCIVSTSWPLASSNSSWTNWHAKHASRHAEITVHRQWIAEHAHGCTFTVARVHERIELWV